MNTRHYYYDKNKKSNCLDCKYPLINEQGINELVHDSVGKYVYINIYDAEGNYKTHWTYNVAFDGVHPNEDYEKGKETRLQHHTKKICNYIREDYVTLCLTKYLLMIMLSSGIVQVKNNQMLRYIIKLKKKSL